MNGGFVPGLGASAAGAAPVPAISAADAVAAAASYFGITLASPPVLTTTTNSIDFSSVVTEPEASATPISARLVYVNTPAGVREAWHFDMDVPAPDQWFDVAVDAQTGQVTFYTNWVDNYSATYTVLPAPTLDPTAGPRVTFVNPYDVAASPFGWQDDDGLGSFDHTDTRGNNVFAQYDPFNVYSGGFGSPSSSRPDAGAGLGFNYPLNLAADPPASVDAAVTNLFYLVNYLHDVHYKYGFDEAAGNFQVTNFTGLGLGDDQVIADVLDGSGNPAVYTGNNTNRNNANFATPPDGFNPQLNMYLYDIATPGRDSSFSTGVVVHEYGHGVSNRLTGGAAVGSTLSNLQSRGMGEGWSDFWSLMFTQPPSGTKLGAYADTNWLMNQPSNGPGDRRYPYSFDMTVNPLTFNDYNLDRSAPPFPGQPEPHNNGEIWASALWDMNWLLIDKYGFDKDLSTGYAPGNGPTSAGNKLALQLVMDGLKLQPVNPTFTEARDAILAADVALTGGQNQREIWTAFARRGLGFAAFTNNSSDPSVSTDFNVPPSLSRPGIIGMTPAARTIGGPAPTSITFTFSEQMNPGSFDPAVDVLTFSGPTPFGQGDLRPAITGFSWGAGNTQLTINFTPSAGNAAQGNYQLRLAPSILSADAQASPRDQNLDGTAGTAADQFVANFPYDATALTALLTSSPSAVDPSLPGSVIAVFNEPIDPASVSVADLQVSEGTVVAATPIRSNPNDPTSPVTTVRFDITGVTTAPLYVTLKYGAVTDPYGFPVEEANASFGRLVIAATPFPTPLSSYGPLGWEAYSTQVTGNLVSFGQIDSYSIVLDAGQSLSVVADQLTSLRAQVRLFDPNGTPIALATGAKQGDPVSVGPVVAPAPGRYVVQITGPSNSVGPYQLRAILGATVENETSNPTVFNDSQFNAQNINGLIATQGGPGSTLRAVTMSGNIGMVRPGSGGPVATPNDISDYYSFGATAGQRTAVGLDVVGSGSTLTLTVRDRFGAVVRLDLPAPGNFDASATFTPATSGTYTVQVTIPSSNTSSRGTDYALAVALNGGLDREPNNTPATAQALQTLNGIVRGGLSTTDQDWYSFTLTAVTDVYLTSLTPGDGPNQPDNFLDPVIELYDLAGSNAVPPAAPLYANDNGAGDGKNALVFADDLPAGTYRFRVRPSPLTSFVTDGEYVVQLSTAANPGPVNPSTGGPYTIAEGADLVLNGSATDPNGDPLTYEWDLNGDGNFTDASGRTPTVTWAQLRALGITDGPATFSIQVRVTDGTAAPFTYVTSVPSSLILDNAAPRAVLYIGGTGTATAQTVDEGSVGLTVRLAPPANAANAPYDPASLPLGSTGLPLTPSLDDSIGLRYSFYLDRNANGAFDADEALAGGGDGTYAGSLTTPTVPVSATLLPDGPGTFTFGVKVIDKDDGTTDPNTGLPVAGSTTAFFTVPYVNAPPTAGVDVLDDDNGNAVLASPYSVAEGRNLSIRVQAVTDPALPDRNGPFRYEYDFNYTGVFAADVSVTSAATTDTTVVPQAGNLDDGDRSLVVAVRVYDKDNGFSEYLIPITVRNVAPSGTLGADTFIVGQPANVGFTGQTDATPVDNLAGYTYRFAADLNGDGDTSDAGEVQTGVSPSASFTFATPGTKTVAGTMTDKDGASFTSPPLTVVVGNVRPTATLVVPPSVPEGATVTVTGHHASAAVEAAGFGFDFDFDGDGTFDLSVPRDAANPLSSYTVAIPARYTADGLRPLSVRARVTESFDGLTGEDIKPVLVLNVNPTATFTGPTGTVRVADRVTFNFTGAADPSALDRASLTYSVDLNNDGDFTDDGEVAGSLTPAVTTQFRAGGSKVVRGRVSDKDGGFTDYFVPVSVIAQPKGGFATGVDAGNAPLVQLYDATGNLKFRTTAFDPAATGGVRVAVADVNGDGIADIVAGTGPGVPAEVRVIDGKNGTVLFSSRPFEGFTGGVFVAAGDMDGDGRAEFAVSPDQGGGPRVIVYRGSGFIQTISFFGIDDAAFRGGARVGMADLNGDGRADLLVSAGFMGGPRVAGFEGSGLLTCTKTKLFNDFFAFEPGLRNGAYLTGGDVNGDGFAELIAGAGPGGAPRVTVYDGASLLRGSLVQVATFFTGNNESRGGVRVTVADVDADGLADVVTGEADGPRVNLFLGKNLKTGLAGDDVELTPFSTPMNGVFVG